jgi:hypothetical protein
LKFTERSQFFQTEVQIDSPYGTRKVYPYRFVPQTSYTVKNSTVAVRLRFSPTGAAFLRADRSRWAPHLDPLPASGALEKAGKLPASGVGRGKGPLQWEDGGRLARFSDLNRPAF